MIELKSGAFDFGSIVVTCDTTKSELLDAYRGTISESFSGGNRVDLKKPIEFGRSFWWCVFTFSSSGVISSIELIPYGFEYRSEKWDMKGRQEERRQYCEGWLYFHLGAPHKQGERTEYKFDTVKYFCSDCIRIQFPRH